MKHIKTFEDSFDKIEKYGFEYAGKWVYFQINTEGSLDKLKIAIEKTGYSDLFYKTYEIPDDDYNPDFNSFYLVFNPSNEIPGRSQCAIKIKLEEFLGKYEDLTYLGEISIGDDEIAANKYNL